MRLIAMLFIALIASGCRSAVQVWELDRVYANNPTAEREHLERRLNRYFEMIDPKADPKSKYIINGYFLVLNVPRAQSGKVQTHIPFVACEGSAKYEVKRNCSLVRSNFVPEVLVDSSPSSPALSSGR